MIIDGAKTNPIYLSALSRGVISDKSSPELIAALAVKPGIQDIARNLDSRLVRLLNLRRNQEHRELPPLSCEANSRVFYQNQEIGKIQILYKVSLPGELQARLAIESAIDRFLEYLQKQYKIVVLDDSEYHVQVFIPNSQEPVDCNQVDFSKYWRDFLENVAFSIYGDTKFQLPGLAQTFIVMLNSITLAERGFSILDVPVINQAQSNILAAWYLAIVREVEKRQIERQSKIDKLVIQLEDLEMSEKERKSKENELQKLKEKQQEEASKYHQDFQKSFGKVLQEQESISQELELTQNQIKDSKLTKAQKSKLQKQQDKLASQIIFNRDSVQQKLTLLEESKGNPFEFVRRDRKQNAEKFQKIVEISKSFDKTATDQINSTRGDIFTKCIVEIYRLLEKQQPYEPLPEAVLTDTPRLMEVRSPGDDNKGFCYSCGVALDSKTAKWKVARFMFERPSQRRQSSSSEDRPYICASCSVLAFASPLKVTDESIILKLKPVNSLFNSHSETAKQTLKNHLRMLTTGKLNLQAGKYLILKSDRTSSGDIASDKLGQVQYALAKIASIFPTEVLADFEFYLVLQGSKEIFLNNRHLVFIQGLMECYAQSIIISGKDINFDLADAVRYVEQDLPCFAEYCLVKSARANNKLKLEQIREFYFKLIERDKESSKQMAKKAQLYRDVTALTGLTYAFVQSLENTAKKAMKPEDAEREMSKIIEKVDDAVAFCYYATLGDQEKRTVQARLYRRPENYFVYEQTKDLLEKTLKISDREEKEEAKQQIWLTLYADDVIRAYTHFAENGYGQERDWNELTYNLKLSLYTRFPELVRKLKTASEKSS